MAPLAEAFVRVRADTSGIPKDIQRGFDKANATAAGTQLGDKAGKGFGSSFGSHIKSAVGAMGAAFAAVKVGGMLKGAIEDASNLNETINKSAVVFGKAAPQIEAWANTAAARMGQTKQQALEAAGGFGLMFTQLGITSKAAAGMSTKMTGLASDIASFSNADISDVLDAQTAAFRGEYDSLQKYIPTLSAAAVEQEGLRLGLAKTAKQLTLQDKAQATYKLMLKGTQAAQGDFARTSTGLANATRIFQAQMGDLSARLGKGLMPIMARATIAANVFLGALAGEDQGKLTGFLKHVNDLAGALRRGADAFHTGAGGASGFTSVMAKAGVIARDVGGRIREFFASGNASKMFSTAMDALRRGLEKVPDLLDRIGPGVASLRDDMPAMAGTVHIAGAAFKFMADHADTVVRLMPLLIGAFAAYKAAQAANNVLDLARLPLAFSQLGVNASLALSNRALAKSINGSVLATERSLAAENTSMFTRLRLTAATVAGRLASLAASAATKAWAGTQWLLNAALTANPIGLVVAALAGFTAAIVIAYKKSETFRHAIDSMWRGIKTIFAEGIKFVVNIFFGFVEKFLRIGGKVIGFFNHDMGAAMQKAADDVNDAKNEINAKLDQLKNPTIKIGVELDKEAQAAIKAFGQKNVIVSGGHLIGVRMGAGKQLAKNAGGQIGNGYGTRDDVPALLTRGEHVWTTAEVRAVGGHAAMEQLRQAALSGHMARYARGGGVDVDLPSHAAISRMAARVGAMGDAIRAGMGKTFTAGLSRLLNRNAANMPGGFAGPGQLGAWISQALRIAGVPANWGAPMRTLVMRESGGNPHAVNLWDINAMRGMPSGGLAQVIGPTFAAYRDRSLPNNVFDPIANLVASLRYIRSRYGSIFNVQQANAALPPKGYDAGGILDHGSTGINTSGRPERVLDPTTTAAFERLVSVLERGGTAPARGASVIVNVAPRQRRLGYDVGNAVASTFILNGWA